MSRHDAIVIPDAMVAEIRKAVSALEQRISKPDKPAMTLTELQALSPDELRVRVAELCGWKPNSTVPDQWLRPSRASQPQFWSSWFTRENLPAYTTSLDSCREFEDAMTDEEHKRFRDNLWKITAPDQSCPWSIDPVHNRAYISATPLQKCQAYVLTKATKTEGAE